MAQEPENGVGPVVAARHGGIFRRPLRFDFGDEHFRARQLQPVGRVLLGAGDFLARKLSRGDRVQAADAVSHVAIGDALYFKHMEAAKIRNLLECQRGILDEPDGGRLWHQGFVAHKSPPVLEAIPLSFLGVFVDCVGEPQSRVMVNIMGGFVLCKRSFTGELNGHPASRVRPLS